MFGESDPDEDVSPDNEDPEARGDGEAGETSNNKKDGSKNGGGPNDSAPATPAPKISTRQWAKDKNYDAEALFNRLFGDDIRYVEVICAVCERLGVTDGELLGLN